jgi:hypothetical protein
MTLVNVTLQICFLMTLIGTQAKHLLSAPLLDKGLFTRPISERDFEVS